MNARPDFSLLIVTTLALGVWASWHAASPVSAVLPATSAATAKPPVRAKAKPSTRPAATDTPSSNLSLPASAAQHEGSGSDTPATPVTQPLAWLATSDKAAATAYLRELAERERTAPGSAAQALAEAGSAVSPEALSAMVDALFPRTTARSLAAGIAMPETMEAALRKLMNSEPLSRTSGDVLAARLSEEPSPGLKASLETVGNPWFLAAVAETGLSRGDAQSVQESLASLEFTPAASTPAALLHLASQGIAAFDDVADTLYHWSDRHRQQSGLTDQLAELLITATDAKAQALIAVALAGGGEPERAREALQKLRQTSPASHQPGIDYALALLTEK